MDCGPIPRTLYPDMILSTATPSPALRRLPQAAAGALTLALGLVLLVALLGRGMFFLAHIGGPMEGDPEPLGADARDPVGHHRVGTWEGPRGFGEAPELRALAESGKIPPVEARLPRDPLVIHPPERNGPYGGSWNRFGTGPDDISAMTGMMYEVLLRRSPMMDDLLPNLARDWRVEENGKRFVFELREGVRWSDGEPFDSGDLMFWYEHVLKNPELTPAPHRAFVRDGELMKMRAPGKHTIEFSFSRPHGLFLYWLAEHFTSVMLQYPAHYFRQFHPEFAGEEELHRRTTRAGFDAWYQYFEDRAEWRNPERPALTAWVITRPPPARRILFERNPYYWKVDSKGNQLPYIDRKTYRISDREAINLHFLGGEMGVERRHVLLRNYPLLKEYRERGDYRIHHWITEPGSSAIMPNLNHRDPVMREIISDRRFRLALSHAIDREEIRDAVYLGLGRPRQITPAFTSPLYEEADAVAHTGHDPARAERLLDEMGLNQRNEEGVRLRPDGRPLSLTIEMFPLLGDIEALNLVADHWKQVGLDADVRQFARSLYYTRMSARLHDVGVSSISQLLTPLLDHRFFIPYHATAPRHALEYASWFLSEGERGERPPAAMRRAIKLYREIQNTTDTEEQTRLGKKIQRINTENFWTFGLIGDLPGLVLVKNSFRNVPDEAVLYHNVGLTAPECYAIEE